MSIRTIKLPYKSESLDVISKYVANYNNVLRFTYNRLYDNNFKLSTKQLTELQKSMNNVLIDSHFLNSAQYEAKQLKDRPKVIFGGRYNYLQRCTGKISNQEFKQNRLQPLLSVGEACKLGNRKFEIKSESVILFKPNRHTHITLQLPKLRKNYIRDMQKLIALQNSCSIPITYKLDLKYIYITFNELVEVNQSYKVDRVFAIDLNPNYIGWSVVDWISSTKQKIIDAGVISNKLINDAEYSLHKSSDSTERKYFSNKRSYENIDTAKFLVEIANHYHCEIFSIEKLEISTKDSGNGRRFNRLVNNQWNRDIFYSQIEKYCDRYGIRLYKVVANYSSFEGNLIYRDTELPDMCLSSIELGRRAYEFHHQYILKDRPILKNIMFDISAEAKTKIVQSLEELNYLGTFDDINSLYIQIKNSGLKYRVQLEDSILKAVCSKKNIKSMVLLYSIN